MKDWREIKSDIYDALSHYDVSVQYHKKYGHGINATCSYFTITIEDDCDWDIVEDELEDVCSEWDLEIDYDSSDGDLDLNAGWDIND